MALRGLRSLPAHGSPGHTVFPKGAHFTGSAQPAPPLSLLAPVVLPLGRRLSVCSVERRGPRALATLEAPDALRLARSRDSSCCRPRRAPARAAGLLVVLLFPTVSSYADHCGDFPLPPLWGRGPADCLRPEVGAVHSHHGAQAAQQSTVLRVRDSPGFSVQCVRGRAQERERGSSYRLPAGV